MQVDHQGLFVGLPIKAESHHSLIVFHKPMVVNFLVHKARRPHILFFFWSRGIGFAGKLVSHHGPVVFLDIPGKVMAAVFFGHKIQVFGLGRVEDGPQRVFAGIGDRPGRQSRDYIGVIGSRPLEVFFGEIPVEVL